MSEINWQPQHPLRLVIHSVYDSRQKDITGKVIHGSGEVLSCEHCGKGIQVHVSVATCEPVYSDAGIVKGYRPVSPCAKIGADCAKKLGALNRTSHNCNFRWVSA